MQSNKLVVAILETAKDLGRWALSYFIAWAIPNGVAFVSDFSVRAHIVVPGYIILGLTILLKYLDYAKHKAGNSDINAMGGISYGLFGF